MIFNQFEKKSTDFSTWAFCRKKPSVNVDKGAFAPLSDKDKSDV